MSKPPKAVIDQPGLKIIVTGLIAALFLGLGLKSQITSIKVSQAVRKSIVSMGSNLEVDFENAEIKLSDWGIPKPYLVINQMRLKNLVKVCGQGQVYVEKLIVPLTFDLIFNPDKAVISPRFNRVEVRVGSTVGCPPLSGPVVAVNVPASATSAPSKTGTVLNPLMFISLINPPHF